MNTPAHLILGMAAFAKSDQRAVILPVLAGALIPDLSLYVMVSWALLVQGVPAKVIFDQLYFSDSWQSVFAVDNSFVLWGAALAISALLGWRWLVLMAASACLHLAFDFALHNDDARRHFWPLTDWVFRSPFSYWDNAHHAAIIGPTEIGICLALSVVLWRRFQSNLARVWVAFLALAETLPALLWVLLF